MVPTRFASFGRRRRRSIFGRAAHWFGCICLAAVWLAPAPFSRQASAEITLGAPPAREGKEACFISEGRALITEERSFTLRPGLNRLAFSWDTVSLDPSDLVIQLIEAPEGAAVRRTAFAEDGQSLVWEVESAGEGPSRVRVGYVLEGFIHSFSYELVTGADENTGDLSLYAAMENNSGEDLRDILLRLPQGPAVRTDFAAGERKRMLIAAYPAVALKKIYRWDGGTPARGPRHWQDTKVYYEITHPAETSGPRVWPLGKVRVWRREDDGSRLLMGEDHGGPTPAGDTMRIFLGDSSDLRGRQNLVSARAVNMAFSKPHHELVLHDTMELRRIELHNARDTKAALEVRVFLGEDWEVSESSLPYKRYDWANLAYDIELDPNRETTIDLTVLRRRVRPGGWVK